MRKAVQTTEASIGDGPYSQAITAQGLLYVSGQGPLDPQTGQIVGETIEEQVELTMSNIRHILNAAGCTMEHVVKVNVFLADLQDYDRFNKTYMSFFNQPMPARTLVEAGLDRIKVEIDAVAVLPTE